MKSTSLATAVALMTAIACGGGGGDDTNQPPSDPDAVVLTVTTEGGFIPVEFNLDRVPRFVLTADRTLYHQGPVPAIFPGPLLPNIQVSTLDEAAFDEVMLLVEELALPDIDEKIDDSGAEMIADAGTTFITYYDDNGAHRLGVYALEFSDGPSSTDRVLANELLQTLDSGALEGESRPYQPERLQVAAGPALRFDDVPGSVEEWPLGVSFDEMDEWGMGWRCVEVTGEEAGELMGIFQDATQATRWDTGTEQLSIKARPLLPGETACSGAPQGS